jgi:hypothetical protein
MTKDGLFNLYFCTKRLTSELINVSLYSDDRSRSEQRFINLEKPYKENEQYVIVLFLNEA